MIETVQDYSTKRKHGSFNYSTGNSECAVLRSGHFSLKKASVCLSKATLSMELREKTVERKHMGHCLCCLMKKKNP